MSLRLLTGSACCGWERRQAYLIGGLRLLTRLSPLSPEARPCIERRSIPFTWVPVFSQHFLDAASGCGGSYGRGRQTVGLSPHRRAWAGPGPDRHSPHLGILRGAEPLLSDGEEPVEPDPADGGHWNPGHRSRPGDDRGRDR